jgi:hypothetical protein
MRLRAVRPRLSRPTRLSVPFEEPSPTWLLRPSLLRSWFQRLLHKLLELRLVSVALLLGHTKRWPMLSHRLESRLLSRCPHTSLRELSPAKATRVAEELKASTEPRETTITAFGTLSIANQELHGFGLRLDRDAKRDPLLRGKRVVNGTYLPEVETKIRDENLWGSEVRATLRVIRDALISTSTVRPATFILLDVEPRYSDG